MRPDTNSSVGRYRIEVTLRNDRILSMLGLAAKGGNLVSGEFQTDKAIKEGKAYLVITALDASDNTKKDFSDACNYYKVPFKQYGTKEGLGHAIGRDYRAVIAVTDERLAEALIGKEEING